MRILFLVVIILLTACSRKSAPQGVDFYGENNNKRMFKANLRAVQGAKPKKHKRHHK